MKLYYMPGACSLATHIALIWAGAPYTLARLSHEEVHGPEFLRVNPKGAVPALVLDDPADAVVTESLATLLLVADRSPGARLGAGPDPLDRARLNEILAELVSEVHKAYGPTFVPDRYTTDAGGKDAAKEAAYRQLDQRFERLDGLMAGKQWVVLDRRTAADAYLYVMCSWKDRTPTPLARYPNLAGFKARLDADEGVQRALQEEAA